MYALLLALALPQADASLQKRISYASPAKRLERMLPELSQRTGLKLKYTNRTQEDVLVVAATDVTVQELMDKIALANGAEWIKRGDEYQLDRSEKLQNEQLQADVAEAVQMYEAAAKKLYQETEATFDAKAAENLNRELTAWEEQLRKNGDEEGFRFEPPQFKQGPINRLLFRLLPAVDWRKVALMEPATHLSFSSKPNSFQAAFRYSVEGILETYKIEQTHWHEALERLEPGGSRSEHSRMGNDPRMHNDDPANVGKVVLSAHLFGSNFPPQMFMSVYGRDGGLMGSTYWLLSREHWNKVIGLNGQELAAEGDLKLSKLSFDYLKLTYPGSTVRPSLTAEWIKRLQNPQDYDPLAYIPSEFLLALANERGKMLVAAPTDQLLQVYGNDFKDGVLNIEQCRKRAELMCGMTFQEQGDWLIARPRRPVLSRMTREDRYAASKLLTSIYDLGYVDPVELGTYAAKNNQGSMWTSLFYHAAALVPGIERIIQESDLPTLRVYAHLSPDNRRALESGQRVPAVALPDDAKQYLSRMIYQELDGFQRRAELKVKSGRGDPVSNENPTEYASGGLAAATLRMTIRPYKGTVAITAANDKYTAWTHVVREAELAEFLGGFPPSPKHVFFFGPAREIALEIDLNEKYRINTVVSELRINMRAAPTLYAQLPAAVRKKAEATRDQRQKNSAEEPPRPGGRAIDRPRLRNTAMPPYRNTVIP